MALPAEPYLHNGSILTLLEVLAPRCRRASHVRGSLAYDEERIGFMDAATAGIDPRARSGWQSEMSDASLLKRFEFDSSLFLDEERIAGDSLAQPESDFQYDQRISR